LLKKIKNIEMASSKSNTSQKPTGVSFGDTLTRMFLDDDDDQENHFDGGARGDAARSTRRADDEEKNFSVFERERRTFIDSSSAAPLDSEALRHQRGSSRKRSTPASMARANEIELNADHDQDFNEVANEKYEDVWANVGYRRQMAAEKPLDAETLAKIEQAVSERRHGETPGGAEKGKGKGKKTTDDEKKEEDVVRTKVVLGKRLTQKEEWMRRHVDRDSGEKTGKNAKNAKGKGDEGNDEGEGGGGELEEVEIEIPRVEIETIQKFTAKIYGQAVTEDEYVDEIKRRVAAAEEELRRAKSTDVDNVDGGGGGKEGMLKQQTDEMAFAGNVSTTAASFYRAFSDDATPASEFQRRWKRAQEAQQDSSQKGAGRLPSIDWKRTAFGRTRADVSATTIDPCSFLFGDGTDQRDALFGSSSSGSVNDRGDGTSDEARQTMLELECQLRRLRYNDDADHRFTTFDSLKQWIGVLGRCSFTHVQTTPYDVSFRSKTNAAGDNSGITVEERVMVAHDLHNGFFVCNHFLLSSSTASTTMDGKPRMSFRWIGYVYVKSLRADDDIRI
jgi:hypothetical protein